MALSGILSTNKYTTSSHGTIGLYFSWVGTQNVANNTTTISWQLLSSGSMSSSYYVQAGPVTVRIAGTAVLNITSRFNLYGGGAFKRTGTITVSHTQEGARNVNMSVKAAIYSSSVNCTASQTFALNTIDRYAILSAVENFDDEGNPTITYVNPRGTDYVTGLKARLSWNDGAEYTSWVMLNDEGGTYTFEFSEADRNRMRSACSSSKTLAVQFDLQSVMDGIEYQDHKAATMSIVNANPVSGGVSYSDVSSAASITGDSSIIVQAQSTLRIRVNEFTGAKGATIGSLVDPYSYRLKFNGEEYSLLVEVGNNYGYADIVKPNYSGTITAFLVVTDSRGNKTEVEMPVDITAWAEPAAECTIQRVNGFETNTTLTVDGTISNVTGSTMLITEKHCEVGGTWSAEATISDNTPTTLSLLNTKEWLVVVSVSDSFTRNTPKTYTLQVAKGIPAMSIGRNINSVGVNGYPEKDGQLFVGGEIKADGVVLPHVYSSTEQKVGYWVDGSPIYEKTIQYSTTISSGGNVTVPSNLWAQKGQPINVTLYSTSGTSKIVWHFVAAQINASGVLQLFNGRAANLVFDTFTIQYVKL